MPFTDTHPHQQLITRQLPAWSGAITAENWQVLHASTLPAQGLPGDEADWFANATPDLREAVLAAQAHLAHSQQQLGRLLKELKQISAFAEPLLAERLKSLHHFEAPLRTAQLVWQHHRFTHEVYVTTHEHRSLLEAALHNFADDVEFSADSALALEGDWQVSQVTVTGTTTLGDSETRVGIDLASERLQIKPLALSPADFASTCRELDLGQRYQDHLQAMLETAEVAAAGITVQRDSLRVAADLARLRHLIGSGAYDALRQLLEDDAAHACQQPTLFGIAVHEAAIIDAGIAGLLLYLPGQDEPLRAFTDAEALAQQLCSDLLDPIWRKRLLAKVASEQRQAFLERALQNLDERGTPEPDRVWTLPSDADVHLQLQPIPGSLFAFLHDDMVERVRHEARLLAVPTAEADEQARKRRLALWQALGLNALMAAGFFIPAIGAVMVAVTAYQLLDEVYEGYEAWRVGDRHEALQHLKTVGINLGIIAGLAGAGKVIGALNSTPLMESLDAVKVADGSQRLCKPDLAPYRSDVELPLGLRANAQGQFVHEGRYFVRMDEQLFEQRLAPESQRWQIVHPENPHAWQPPLEHNGEGAWRAQHEQPQDWGPTRLVRRLGPEFADVAEADVALAMNITGIDAAALRHVHLGGLATPPLLADTLRRLAIMRAAQASLPGEPAAAVTYRFERLYSNGFDDVASERLWQTFPSLSRPLASRLLAALKGTERDTWLAQGVLPPRVDGTVQQVLQSLTVTRGLEGLHVAALAETPTERLVFACLPRLEGWPADVRIELRAGSPSGPLLQHSGLPLAARTVRVFKSAEGFEPDLGERPGPAPATPDLLEAVFRALPAQLRTTLSDGGDAAALRQRLQALIDSDRPLFDRRLGSAQPRPWHQRIGLAGGVDPSGQRPANALRTSFQARYRALFPLTTADQAQGTLRRWRLSVINPEAELARLEDRLATLRTDLRTWAGQSLTRLRAISPIISAWRRVTVVGLADGSQLQVLDLARLGLIDEDLATLALPDDFQHVTELNLSGNPGISRLPAELHERFPALARLKLRRSGFHAVPELAAPHALIWLEMDRNPLVWNDAAQMTFDRYVNLRVVDFSSCPLGRSPDLSRHPAIVTLYMDDCGLSQLPTGLQHLNEPLLLDFARNPLTTLPPAEQLPAGANAVMRLESAALSPQILDRIQLHYEITGIDLLVPDTDYEELLTDATDFERHIWKRLPLAFRRALRELLESDNYLDSLPYSRNETWRRLVRMEQDPPYRRRVLAQPAVNLLDLRLPNA